MMKLKNTIFIFDVDSTLVRKETLEEVMRIAMENNDDRVMLMEKIQKITNLGMTGKLDFKQSLTKRLAIVSILQKHLDLYNEKILLQQIDFNFKIIIQIIRKASSEVFIVSGGFRENVNVVADALGINKDKIFANEFVKSKERIVGFVENNLLSNSDGKVRVVEKIKLANPDKRVVCIGDGNSDYLVKKENIANEFWGFWGNVQRKNIEKKADRNFYSSEELLKFIRSLK